MTETGIGKVRPAKSEKSFGKIRYARLGAAPDDASTSTVVTMRGLISSALLSALAAVTPVLWCASRKSMRSWISLALLSRKNGEVAGQFSLGATRVCFVMRGDSNRPGRVGWISMMQPARKNASAPTRQTWRRCSAMPTGSGHSRTTVPGCCRVEPLPAVTAPERTAAQHQSLLHFVAQAPWSDQAVYEGRGWRGFHHHAALCIAAYGFLISGKETISPLGPTRAWRGLQRSQSRERGRPTSRCHQDTKVVGPLPVEHSGWQVSWPITLASGIACMGCCRGCGASATC